MKDPYSKPYYMGTTRLSSSYMLPREVANEMRYIASVIPADLYRADDRKAALIKRAAEIDAGQIVMTRHFTVFIPHGKKTLTLPCSGHSLYTFDEAWLILEAYAARRGFTEDGDLDCWAEGIGQNMDLGIIYNGIADPMREIVENRA